MIQVQQASTTLILKASQGDDLAVEDLIKLIRDNFMGKAIARYISKNRLVYDEDIRQEFLIGVALAIPKVNMEIGNPMLYLINSGIYRVKSYFRGKVLKYTRQTCLDCGHTCRPHYKKDEVDNTKSTKQWQCPKCGSLHVDIVQTTNAEVKDDNVMGRTEALIEDIVSDSMVIEEFRSTLKGRVLQLFDLINSGVDRDGTSSYMKDIAQEWGVSTACVAQYLKRLRAAWKEYFNDEVESAIDRRIG